MKIVELGRENLDILIAAIHDHIREDSLIGLCGGRSVIHATNAMLNHVLQDYNSKFNKATYITIDERLVDPTDPDSNFKLLSENYFSKLLQCKSQYFDHNRVEQSLKEYSNLLNAYQSIDLSVLGVGEDGHIAGLFPNLPWDEVSAFFTFQNSPKPPQGRMTASPNTITKSKNIILLFIGDGKKEAFQKFIKAEETYRSLPCLITKSCRNLYVVTDLRL